MLAGSDMRFLAMVVSSSDIVAMYHVSLVQEGDNWGMTYPRDCRQQRLRQKVREVYVV
jgi:hypothetical protein